MHYIKEIYQILSKILVLPHEELYNLISYLGIHNYTY